MTRSVATRRALHDLSGVNPARVHLTVPPGFRRQLPSEVVLRRGLLQPGGWVELEGYRMTTPLCGLLDIAESPTSWPSLEPAVRDAIHRGLVCQRQLLAVELPRDAYARLVAALEALDAAEAAEQTAGA